MLALTVVSVVLVVCSSLLLVDGEVVEWVWRRYGEDFYKYTSSSSHERCDGQTKATFLVADGQCVDNQDLFTGCTHVIVPSSQLVAIATMISSNVSTLHLVGKNDPNSAERFYFNETDQPANSSFCHIASLEVFRGWEQAIQISHDGFSLSDNSTVKIETASLKYSLDDFLGELYRINISCNSSGSSGLPEGGCVFFKAIGPLSNVTHAKFRCTVPGTLMDYDDTECQNFSEPSSPTTSSSKISTETITMRGDVTSIMDTNTAPSDEESNGRSSTHENGDLLTTVLAVLGSGIIIVILAIVVLSFVLGRKLWKDKRRSFSMEMTERYENPYRLSEDDYPEPQQGDRELHQQDGNTAQLVQETVFSATSNGENDISDTSMTHGNVYSAVRQAAVEDDHLESVQIYNNVAPIVAHTHEEEAADERRYANVSRSLNTSTGDLTVDYGGTAVSHADDPNRIYSVPDMKKKREERQKKREQMENRERLVDTAESFSLSSPPNFNVREKHVRSDSVSKETDSEYENISHSMELNPNRATTESDDFTPNQSQCGAEVSVSNSDDSVPIYSVPDMKKKREERQKKREQIEDQERSADKAEVFTMSSPPNFNMKGMLMSAHLAETYCNININHTKPADLLEEAGDYQNVSRGELCDNHNLDQSPYDNPVSLNLVPKRSKDKDQ